MLFPVLILSAHIHTHTCSGYSRVYTHTLPAVWFGRLRWYSRWRLSLVFWGSRQKMVHGLCWNVWKVWSCTGPLTKSEAGNNLFRQRKHLTTHTQHMHEYFLIIFIFIQTHIIITVFLSLEIIYKHFYIYYDSLFPNTWNLLNKSWISQDADGFVGGFW